MGLNTTHGCYDGSYSGFNNFRRRLAKLIGYDLDSFIGFGGHISFDEMDHPLEPLLNHSDCDGELTVDECREVIKGFNMVLEKIDIDETSSWDEQYFLQRIHTFIEGCELAIEEDESVEFH